MTMTGAEFKTLREYTGLPVAALAKLAGVQERTVRYWEDDSRGSRVPDDVVNTVENINTMLDRIVDESVAAVRARIAEEGKRPDSIALIRYRTDEDLWHYDPAFQPLPVTVHAAMLSRARIALADLHVRTWIIYLDRDGYEKWLDGRADSTVRRTEWASLQPPPE